jgi:hypothetical protein
MKLGTVIAAIRTEWAKSIGTTLHLQLAPESAQVPYAVLRIGAISPGEGDTATKDYETTIQLIAFYGTDAEAVTAIDAMSDTFDRGRFDGVYSSLLTSATLDLQYTDAAALWTVETAFSIRWTQEL